MAKVFIPPGLRELSGGVEQLEIEGQTVAEIIQNLEARHPGFAAQLVHDGRLRPGWSVVVGGSISALGLRQRVAPDAEVHFLPAIGGG